MILFRSILFYLIFIISIPPTAIIMWIISLFIPKSAWFLCRLWGKFVNFILRVICNIKIEVKGDIAKNSNPCLILANHTGPWETVAIMPYIPFDFTYVLKKQLISWKYNFFAMGIRSIKPIPISRESNAGDFTAITQLSQERFKKNISVMIFPGGTRKALNESLDYGVGGILLAKKIKCPVKILFVDSEKWSRGKYIKDYGLLYPGKIRIHFGDLISKEEISLKKAKELHEQTLNFYNKFKSGS
ncbi:MAG: Phospholipid/glycerol acyltransferase [uncultured bacterium]|nr:MAG: Phospholipid/glycerol acyltransferase [uncultured bacterium]